MRQVSIAIATGALFVLAGCGEAARDSTPTYADEGLSEQAEDSTSSPSILAEANAEAAAASLLDPLTERPIIPVNMPKMAYVFDYGFSLESVLISGIQQKHADMCEDLGPYSCQIVSMTHSGDSLEDASGQLQLAVVSDKARSFGTALSASVITAGGEQTAANIMGEDMSKQMVDTQARLKSRVALRDRLLDVLKTRKGSVSDLVEAERSVARVNEEIDQARSWLEETRGRVSFSRVNLSYSSMSANGGAFLDPVNSALGSIAAITGTVLGLLIILAAAGLPIGGALWAIIHLRRRYGQGNAGAEA